MADKNQETNGGAAARIRAALVDIYADVCMIDVDDMASRERRQRVLLHLAGIRRQLDRMEGLDPERVELGKCGKGAA
jgi:hypothetical protein